MGNCIKIKNNIKHADSAHRYESSSKLGLKSLKTYELPTQEIDTFACFQFHADTILAAYSKSVYLYDFSAGTIVGAYTQHSRMVNEIAIIGNDIIASAGFDTNINIWNLRNTEQTIKLIPAHQFAITALLSVNENMLISGSKDYSVKLWAVSYTHLTLPTKRIV